MKTLKVITSLAVLAVMQLGVATTSVMAQTAQAQGKPKYATEMPAGITAPADSSQMASFGDSGIAPKQRDGASGLIPSGRVRL